MCVLGLAQFGARSSVSAAGVPTIRRSSPRGRAGRANMHLIQYASIREAMSTDASR
jgi:hypothetical protein